MPAWRFRTLILAALAVTGAGCSGAPALLDRTAEDDAVRFDGRGLLVLADADMAGTAYADGRLHPQPGASDTVTVFGSDGQALASTAASNSVMGWPGALDVSDDGRFAYVVETRAPPPSGVSAYQSIDSGIPEGRSLTAIDVGAGAAPRVMGIVDVGRQPTSVDVSPDGRFALVSRKENPAPLAAVLLASGVPVEVTPLQFPLAVAASHPNDEGALYVRIAPNGRDFAINIANTHVQFGRLEFDRDGVPVAAVAIGEPVAAGRWISMLRWSADGRHVIVADVAWSASQLGAVLNGPGALVSIAFDPEGRHRQASRAQVSLSPEGFEINRAGDLLVAVNMERTYLPERLPYTLFGRREWASLLLVRFDADSGALSVADGPLRFEAVLPEDAVFDADGDMIAVAVFHGRGAEARAGWLAYFRVERSGGDVRLTPLRQRTPTPRGAHDLALIP